MVHSATRAGAVRAGVLLSLALVCGCIATTPPSVASSVPSFTAVPAPASSPASPSSAAPAVGTWPLTGLPRYDSLTKTVFVKVDNVAGALPQTGLELADMIVEEPVEGGLTRLLAVFQSHLPPAVGPVRSARPEDATFTGLIGAGTLVYSGASKGEQAGLSARTSAPLWAQEAGKAGFWRGPGQAPHNLYVNLAQVTAAPTATSPFTFGATTGTPARAWSGRVNSVPVTWTWTGTAWVRTQSGVADRTRTGVRLSAADVIILHVAVVATGLHDVAGHATPEPVLTGDGNVEVYQRGQVVHGQWSRTDGGPLELTCAGVALQLTPGVTWVEVLPNNIIS